MWWTVALIALPAVVLAASSSPAEVLASDTRLQALSTAIDAAIATVLDSTPEADESLERAKQLVVIGTQYQPEEVGRYIRLCQPKLKYNDSLSGDYKTALDAIDVSNYCPSGPYVDCLLYLTQLHQPPASNFHSPARQSYSDRCGKMYANPRAGLKQLAFCLSVANASDARPTFSVLQSYENLINVLPTDHRLAYQALMVANTPVLCAAQFFLKSEDMAIFCKDAYGKIYSHFNQIGNTMGDNLDDILNAGTEGNEKLVEQFPNELGLLKDVLQTSLDNND